MVTPGLRVETLSRRTTPSVGELVVLLDVDNTLLDNDTVKLKLAEQARRLVGPERAERFWELYEEIRREADYVDVPLTLARFRAAFPDESGYPELATAVLCFPFPHCLFPDALETVAYLATIGTPVILSDGDAVWQPAKIARAGLAAAVGGRVLVYVHKEEHLDDVTRRFPAERYVLVDDKPNILARAKARLGERLLTIQVHQGKYARADRGRYPAADLEIETIGDLRAFGPEAFRAARV